MAYKHVLTEVSISNIIKQLRVLKAATKQTLSAKDWKLLKHRYELKAYSDLESEDCQSDKIKTL